MACFALEDTDLLVSFLGSPIPHLRMMTGIMQIVFASGLPTGGERQEAKIIL
jgi:hypothetical protein